MLHLADEGLFSTTAHFSSKGGISVTERTEEMDELQDRFVPSDIDKCIMEEAVHRKFINIETIRVLP